MSMMEWPFVIGGYVSLTSSTTTLDAQNEKVGHCGFWVTPDGLSRSITHVCYAVSNYSAQATIRAQIESIDANGLYAGIIAADRYCDTVVSANGWVEAELETAYTLTSGSKLAVTMELTSATGSLRIIKSNSLAQTANFAWVTEALSSAQAKGNYSPNVALKCSTNEYLVLNHCNAITIEATPSISTSSNPRYIGNEIIMPFKCLLAGLVVLYFDNDQGMDFKLMDAAGSVLKADDGATDMAISTTSGDRGITSGVLQSTVMFPVAKTLIPGLRYYLSYVPTSGTNSSTKTHTYNSASLKNQCREIPDGWSLSLATSPESVSWTVTNEAIANIVPYFDGIEIPRFTQKLRA